jgi:small subunit ribosomal protein S4
VNGDIVNIPSYQLKPGDELGVREKSKSIESITESLSTQSAKKYTWLEWNDSSMLGKFVTYPQRDEIPENIQEQLIVELYSK